LIFIDDSLVDYAAAIFATRIQYTRYRNKFKSDRPKVNLSKILYKTATD